MILKNKVIVFLGNTRFDGPIKATSLFIARNLAKENKVYFIDYPFTLKDYFKYVRTDELKERKEKFSIFSDGIINTDLPNLKIVITPPVLTINFLPEGPLFRSFLKVNEDLICLRLKKVFRQQGIKEFIYINSFNFHYPNIAGRLKPALTVYQCVDPMIVPYDMKHGLKSEEQLVRQSDLVVCTSKALYLEKKKLNTNTYFVPNGTDLSHLEELMNVNLPIHEKLKEVKKPVIGYLGTIERRIDYELIQQVIKQNPDKNFVLAGPVAPYYTPGSLFNLTNVVMTGTVHYDDVPQMINGFDVAIIPFKKDKVSNTIFPIKLFEYLSAGKPVVMTDFNTDLKEYTEDLVDYCSDAASFTAAINYALQNDSAEKVARRKSLALKNTWEMRTNEISEIISSHLEKKI
jgi:teichuronic acid biosynthesis glycosyltransferase TuaH